MTSAHKIKSTRKMKIKMKKMKMKKMKKMKIKNDEETDEDDIDSNSSDNMIQTEIITDFDVNAIDNNYK